MNNAYLACYLTQEILEKDELSYLSDQKIIRHRETGAHVVVGVYRGKTWIVFKGTQKDNQQEFIKDIVTSSLWFPKKIYKDGAWCHYGFWRAFASIDVRLEILLSDEKYPAEIILTGHSMGGCLAILAAFYYHLRNIDRVYVFGAPRLFNQKFRDNLYRKINEDNVFNFVNGLDLITHLPFKIFGFVDIGKRFYLTYDNNIFNKLHENYLSTMEVYKNYDRF